MCVPFVVGNVMVSCSSVAGKAESVSRISVVESAAAAEEAEADDPAAALDSVSSTLPMYTNMDRSAGMTIAHCRSYSGVM